MSIVYHRGYHRLNNNDITKPIENTLEAFVEAYNNGAKLVECDIRLSKDNEIIIWHDETVNSYTSNRKKGAKLLSELELSKIKRIKLINKSQIITLNELIFFIYNRNIKLVLDVKTELTGIVLANYLNKNKHFIKKIELIISFSQNTLYHFYNNISVHDINSCWIVSSHFYTEDVKAEGEVVFSTDDKFLNNYLKYNLLFQENNVGLYLQYNTNITIDYITKLISIMKLCKFKEIILGIWNDIELFPNYDNKYHINNMLQLFDYVNVDKPINN